MKKSKKTIFFLFYLSLQCLYAQKVMQTVLPLDDKTKIFYKKLREEYPVLKFLTIDYKNKPDTILLFQPFLIEEWKKSGVRFPENGARVTYCFYGKENGQVDVVTFGVEGEMSDSDLQKMKKAMKKVFKKHRLPANDKKFHFCISSKFTN